jgi:hypothetical protein
MSVAMTVVVKVGNRWLKARGSAAAMIRVAGRASEIQVPDQLADLVGKVAVRKIRAGLHDPDGPAPGEQAADREDGGAGPDARRAGGGPADDEEPPCRQPHEPEDRRPQFVALRLPPFRRCRLAEIEGQPRPRKVSGRTPSAADARLRSGATARTDRIMPAATIGSRFSSPTARDKAAAAPHTPRRTSGPSTPRCRRRRPEAGSAARDGRAPSVRNSSPGQPPQNDGDDRDRRGPGSEKLPRRHHGECQECDTSSRLGQTTEDQRLGLFVGKEDRSRADHAGNRRGRHIATSAATDPRGAGRGCSTCRTSPDRPTSRAPTETA